MQVESLFPQARRKSQHQIRRRLVGLKLEYRRTQVEVQPPQVQVGSGKRLLDRPFGVTRLDREAEFGIDDAGGRVGVRVRIDARRHPHQDVLRFAGVGADVLQQVQLVKAVDHDPAYSGAHRLLELGGRLVVPVEIHLVQRHIPGHRHGQLTSRHHVQAQSLLRENSRQRRIDVRLGSVHRLCVGVPRRECVPELLALGTQSRLVENVQRRAVFLHQVDGVAAADGEVPGWVGIGSVGENVRQVPRQHGVNAPSLCNDGG